MQEEEIYKWRRFLYDYGDKNIILHSEKIAERLQTICKKLKLGEEESFFLLSAAYLHDIGKSEDLNNENFHPLDSAFFAEEKGADDRLSSFVAFHSGAKYIAKYIGIDLPFIEENSLSQRLFDYCDMTTNQQGEIVSLESRYADILHRYGTSPQTYAFDMILSELKQTEQELNKLK